MTEFDGYLITVAWDGDTLRVHGKNKMARVALNGADHAEDVILTVADIAQVQFKNASILTNGALTIRTTANRKHVLHFRRPHQQNFAGLAQQLGWQR
jgi:hypothetical protein